MPASHFPAQKTSPWTPPHLHYGIEMPLLYHIRTSMSTISGYGRHGVRGRRSGTGRSQSISKTSKNQPSWNFQPTTISLRYVTLDHTRYIRYLVGDREPTVWIGLVLRGNVIQGYQSIALLPDHYSPVSRDEILRANISLQYDTVWHWSGIAVSLWYAERSFRKLKVHSKTSHTAQVLYEIFIQKPDG
jgi:hypothetical protein